MSDFRQLIEAAKAELNIHDEAESKGYYSHLALCSASDLSLGAIERAVGECRYTQYQSELRNRLKRDR